MLSKADRGWLEIYRQGLHARLPYFLGRGKTLCPVISDEATASHQAAQEETLRSILHTMAELEQERTAKQAEFQSPQAIGRRAEITQQIKAQGADRHALSFRGRPHAGRSG
jgi:hypothetical protein